MCLIQITFRMLKGKTLNNFFLLSITRGHLSPGQDSGNSSSHDRAWLKQLPPTPSQTILLTTSSFSYQKKLLEIILLLSFEHLSQFCLTVKWEFLETDWLFHGGTDKLTVLSLEELKFLAPSSMIWTKWRFNFEYSFDLLTAERLLQMSILACQSFWHTSISNTLEFFMVCLRIENVTVCRNWEAHLW